MLYDQLKNIATKSLRACYAEGKVLASPTHFSDFWARDTFWAVPGMLSVGDHAQAKRCLNYFLSYQKPNGKLPRKMSRDINVLKYLFGCVIKRKKPRPIYSGLVWPFATRDSELLFVHAAVHYMRHTGDTQFCTKNYQKISSAILWHMEREEGGLVREAFLANWMDTVFKFGATLSTNVLYAQALSHMVEIAHVCDKEEDAIIFATRSAQAKKIIQERFWNGSFFADELRLKRRKTFDLAGNVLAVFFDIATQEQKRKIVAEIKKYYMKHGSFLPAVPTGHKWWKVNPVVQLLGFADYQTNTSWLWIDALAAHALYTHGEQETAQEMFADFEKIVQRDGEIGETYFQSGKPYQKRLWKSASPFAWSSGVILEALDFLA